MLIFLYIFHIISASPLSPETIDCKSKTKSAMEDLFGDVLVVKVEEAKPISARAWEEIHVYKSLQGLQLWENHLTLWKENEEKFPLLTKLDR